MLPGAIATPPLHSFSYACFHISMNAFLYKLTPPNSDCLPCSLTLSKQFKGSVSRLLMLYWGVRCIFSIYFLCGHFRPLIPMDTADETSSPVCLSWHMTALASVYLSATTDVQCVEIWIFKH